MRKQYYGHKENSIRYDIINEKDIITEIFIRNTKIENFDFLENRKDELRKLIIDECNLLQIPLEVLVFKKLENLSLSGNKIINIPNDINKLENLTTLCLMSNEITKISNEFYELKSLKTLNLSNNFLFELDKDIIRLTNLEELKVDRNKLETIPYYICELSELMLFSCNNNNVKNVCDELYDLFNLEELDLSNNKIINISHRIGDLANLKRLNLSNNLLKKIPKEIGKLINLEILDISNNMIEELPPEILKLKNLRIIKTTKNPILSPPVEIIKQGLKAIFNYFREIDTSTELYEAKLLLVGEGNVGKSSLAKKIMNDQFVLDTKEKTTEGIDIIKWNIPHNETTLTINVWDFGGQEIYHSTHQFFLTKRSIYVFLWEARRDDHHIHFDYWLNVIKLLAGNSPVLVVQNKIDERKALLNQDNISKNFKNIKNFFDISTKDNMNIDSLKTAIISEFKNLEHIGTKLPKVWLEIRNELEELNRNYISYSTYLEICYKHGLDEERATFMSRYYHDLGFFLNFDDNIALKSIVFLNPTWATNAVYKLLDYKPVIENNGKFSYEHLHNVWQGYVDSTYYSYIVELMKKFELCFPLNENEYIIPELLCAENTEINTFKFTDECLKVQYRYDFMPSGIITRFIVKMHTWINNSRFTKHKVMLKYKDTVSLVSSDSFKRTIDIIVQGNDKLFLLNSIRNAFDGINKSLNFPEVTEKIPCNCKYCIKEIDPHYFEYSFVEKMMNKNINESHCIKSCETVNLDKLLTQYDRKNYAFKNTSYESNKNFIFISHSSKDKEIAQEIAQKLKAHNIEYWIDNEKIKFGDGIAEKINEGLVKSNIMILLFSNNLKESNWCRAEYDSAISSSITSKKMKIIPVLLDDISIQELYPLLIDKRSVNYRHEKEINDMISQLQ